MWNILESKVPMWHILQKRQFNRPAWYFLCQNSLKDISHTFLDSEFTKTIWVEALRILNYPLQWQGRDVQDDLRSWSSKKDTKHFHAMPLILSWGMWIYHTKFLSQDGKSTPPLISTQAIGVLSHFPKDKDSVDERMIQLEGIDHSNPWVFFMARLIGIAVYVEAPLIFTWLNLLTI